MQPIQQIKKAFPTLKIVDLQGYGINVYLQDRVLTIYWKKRKWGDNKTNTWNYFKDIKDLISVIDYVNNQPFDEDNDICMVNGEEQKRAEHILKHFLGETTDSFDANYRSEILEAMVEFAKRYKKKHDYRVDQTGSQNNTQKCIDHLNQKAERIFKANSKPELGTLLKTTAEELTQYL